MQHWSKTERISIFYWWRLRSGRVGWRLAAAFLVTLWVLGRHSGSYQEVAGTGRLWKALIVRSLIISCKWRAIEMFTLLYYIKTSFLKNSMKYLNKYFTRISLDHISLLHVKRNKFTSELNIITQIGLDPT